MSGIYQEIYTYRMKASERGLFLDADQSIYLAVPARFRFRPVSACSRPGGAVDAGNCQARSCSGEETRINAAPNLLKGSGQRKVGARER